MFYSLVLLLKGDDRLRKIFADLIEQHTPRFNKAAVDGLSNLRISRIVEYIDSIFRSASKTFPPGLEYIGCAPYTPYEEYMESTRPHNNNKRTYDMARSDLYMYKFMLAYNGEPLRPKAISLPYLSNGGIFWLGGSPYHITPVLSDQVLSIGYDSVFVRLVRDKLIFKRISHTINCDNKTEAIPLVWSRIHRNNTKSKVPPTTKAESTVLHYLLCRYGFAETLRRLIGTDVLVCDSSEINKYEHDPSDWVVCSSVGVPPKTYIGNTYVKPDIYILVPRTHWNIVSKSVISGCFYLIDHFPDNITINSLENKDWWSILLGHIVHSGNFSQGKLYSSIMEHFASIEDYVDAIIIRKLETIGYKVRSLYDLFELIINNFHKWSAENQNQLTSIYNKTLELEYYVGYDITSSIFRFMFSLNKMAGRKELSKKDIEELMMIHIKTGDIYKIRSGNLAVSSVNYSGDNKYPKITSVITEQESRFGPKRGEKRRKIPDETKRFHTSMLELGSFLFLPGSNPVPIARINPYTTINPEDDTILPKMYPELLRSVQNLINIQNKSLPEEVSNSLPR